MAQTGHDRTFALCPLSGGIVLQKSFPPVIKNSPGFKRDFRVKMWGTSSSDDKLAGDFGNVIEATQIGGRQSNRFMAGKLSPANCRLLQQYRGVKRTYASVGVVFPDPMRRGGNHHDSRPSPLKRRGRTRSGGRRVTRHRIS